MSKLCILVFYDVCSTLTDCFYLIIYAYSYYSCSSLHLAFVMNSHLLDLVLSMAGSSPDSHLASVSEAPPMCFPFTKTLGTVR